MNSKPARFSPKQLRLLKFAGVLFISICWGNSLWIFAKASVAQLLIADAWQLSLIEREPIKPWSWADTWPVAKLDFPALNKQLYVLSGSSGTSLAFGPGHLDGTALPDEQGTVVINGHRDTHFSLLAELKSGDIVRLQSASGVWYAYSVSSIHIIDTLYTDWIIAPENNELQLITCYPFNSINPNPSLRYVVVASRVS